MIRDGFIVDDYAYSDDPEYLRHCLRIACDWLLSHPLYTKVIGPAELSDLLLQCRLSCHEDGRDENIKNVSFTIHAKPAIIEKLNHSELEAQPESGFTLLSCVHNQTAAA